MFAANAPHTKPQEWGRILLAESESFKNIYDLFNNLIDPRLVYFNQKITKEQSEICKNIA